MPDNLTPMLYFAVLERPSYGTKYFPLYCFEKILFEKTLIQMQEEGCKQLYRTELPTEEMVPNSGVPPMAFKVNRLIDRANDIGRLNIKELEVLLNN